MTNYPDHSDPAAMVYRSLDRVHLLASENAFDLRVVASYLKGQGKKVLADRIEFQADDMDRLAESIEASRDLLGG